VRSAEAEARIRPAARGLARAGVIGIVGAAVAGILGWVRAKGLALTLDPAGLGVYGQVWAFVIYASGFASLGIGVGTTALIAAHRQRRERLEIASVARASLAAPAAVGFAVAAVTLALATVLAPLVLDKDEPWLIALAALSIPFATIQLPLQHVLQGFEDVVGQNVVYVVYGAVFTVAAVAGAYVGGVYGAAAGLAIGNAALAVLYLVRTRSLLARAHAPLSDARRELGSLRALLRIGAASLVITVAYGAADLGVRTTLIHTHGSRVAGYWFALLTISIQFIGSLAGALSYFTAPLAARAHREDDRGDTQHLLDDSLRIAIAVIVPVLALLVAARQQLAGILFTDEFDPIARWLPLQATADAIRTVGWVLGVALVPLGLTRAWLVIGVGASVVYAAVGALFAAKWGLGGASAAWLVAWTASTAATVAVVAAGRFWHPSLRVLGGLLLTAAALGAATLYPGAIGVVAALVATAGLLATLIRPSERTQVVRALLFWRART
jgi:O-antigen/teichoic acid export membrane protein